MDSAVKSDSSGALGSAIVGTNQTAVLPSAGVDGISAIIFLLGTFRLRRIRCHGRRLTPDIVFWPTDSRRRRIMLLRQRCKRFTDPGIGLWNIEFMTSAFVFDSHKHAPASFWVQKRAPTM